MNDFALLSGSANRGLAASIARLMHVKLINDSYADVHGRDVFIIQPTPAPVNEHLMELLSLANAARRAGALRVIAVIPHFGYLRSEQGNAVARILRSCGIEQIITLDPHLLEEALAGAIRHKIADDSVIVSPHAKAFRMACCFGEILGLPVIELHHELELKDVADRPILLVDDIIASGTTMVRAIETLIGAGARLDFTLAAVHGVLLREARKKLELPLIRQIVVTDSVAPQVMWPRMKVVSIAPLIVNAIEHAARFRPLAAA